MNSDFSVDQQATRDMICQLCLAKQARHRVTEPSSRGRLEEAYYCPECYETKYVKPPQRASVFPRPRFTLKGIMVLVAAWAVPNAVTAWVMRSGYITGTPAQLRWLNTSVFLGVNLVFGFFVVCFSLQDWIGRIMWYNRTGGLLPIPELKLTPGQQRAAIVWSVSCFAWGAVAFLLAVWLAPKIWPMQRPGLQLFLLIFWAPLPLIVVLWLSKNRAMRSRIRQGWGTMLVPERVLRVVAMAWCVGVLLVLWFGDRSIVFWGFSLWFPIPPFLLFGIVVALLLMAAVATSTRRR